MLILRMTFYRLLSATLRRARCIFRLGSLVFVWYSPLSFCGEYDQQIEAAAIRYLPMVTKVYGYEILKAQFYQESLLNPDAVSPVGAGGIAQFMPNTWTFITQRMNIQGSRFNADLSIKAGAYYMAYLHNQWHTRRTPTDRLNLAFSSYNAGLGNILKAQAKCNNASSYAGIIRCLPQITGHHSQETIGYVKSIWKHYYRFKWGAF